MPELDVTDLLADPDFAQDFTVLRSARVVGDDGQTADTQGYFPTYGVITPSSGAQLQLIPEAERINGFVTVITPFRLVGLTDTNGPDQVLWQNKYYRVRTVNDWTDWGQGFVMAVCELTGMTTDGP